MRPASLLPLALLATSLSPLVSQELTASPAQQPHRNVILFVADGLRRGSVNPTDTPTLYKLRTTGTDFPNSHSVYPTFTTANASVIATGHGLGDTGDYANAFYPGVWLTRPDPAATNGTILPFIENDEFLADLNSTFTGNYLGEKPFLSVAREHGYNVASVGKIGPTAIQQIDSVSWNQLGLIDNNGAIIFDDSTGSPTGIALPQDILSALAAAHLPADAPTRSNGYSDTSQQNNGNSGDAINPGTLAANRVQEQWFSDVTTQVLLPKFAADNKPFALLFWSRDPDGTQHNQGDSLQTLTPGINGDTSKLGLHNADDCLKRLLDWLDAHPAIKANTDVLVTSDHGFATVTRREISTTDATAEPSAVLDYELSGKEKAEPKGTLPQGFLAVDLAIRLHLRLFDALSPRPATGSSAYTEVLLGGEKSQHPSGGSALLADKVTSVDGSDAQILVATNGGSDLIYVPSKNPEIVRNAIAVLTQLDYIGAVFADDSYCPSKTDCPGALPLSAVGLVGSSKVPRPAIVVAFKNFYQSPGDLQSSAQISDGTLQEGQGQHGGFGREQTLNNMAAIGPDFNANFSDPAPMGNIDIVPTLAHILGIDMPSTGTLRGRVLTEALRGAPSLIPKPDPDAQKTLTSAPAANGLTTVLHYQILNGVHYYDDACLVSKPVTTCH